MHAIRSLAVVMICIGGAAAAEPTVLKLAPAKANLVIQIENPRKFAETIVRHDVTQRVLELPFVREQVDTPAFHRFLQLVRYYEKDFGAPWPELIDRLAGGGITIAGRAGDDNSPALVLIQSKDEALAQRFVQRLVEIIEQEQVRTDSKERPKKGEYRGVEGWKLGDEALIARIGTTLLFTNKNEALKAAIDLHRDGGKTLADRPEIPAARKTLPANCHAWLWLDLDYAKQSKEAKEQFALPTNDALQLFLIGGWANAVFRAPHLVTGLYEEAGAFTVSARLAAGRDGMPEALALHVPPEGKPGALPLLEPKGTLYSQSFYFDVPSIWNRRQQLFNDMIAKQFDDAQKQVGKFLPGSSLNELLTQAGSHHRVVVVHHTNKGYKTRPAQILPAFALVTSYRDPKFARSFEGVLRGAALLATQQFKLRLDEETHGSVKIVHYRFDEKAQIADDAENLRFNFTPSMAAVHDQFIISSNIELCRELIDLLQAEQRGSPKGTSPAAFRARFYAEGGADVLQAFEDQVLAQVILDQAVPPAEARQRTAELMKFVRGLGTLELRSEYSTKETRLEAVWKRSP